MKNICIFCGDMSRGGGTQHMAQTLANGLDETGMFKVLMLDIGNKDGVRYYAINESIQFDSIKSIGIYNNIRDIRKYVKKNKIDIVINVDVMLGIYSFPATLGTRASVVSWEMFSIHNDIGSRHAKLIRSIALRFSAYYIVLTHADLNAFRSEYQVCCPIEYIYNPCTIDLNYAGYNAYSKKLLTLGHFYYTKGYDLAIDVARIVFSKHPDWQWDFYGDGPEEENIRKAISSNNLENNVFIRPRTKNVSEVYKAASIYVLTSRTEGFGLVLVEAKANNLPVVSFDCEYGPAEIVKESINGYLVPAFDTVAMAKAICELIENTEKRINFSQKAQQDFDKFSMPVFIEKWTRILNSIGDH